MKTGADEVMRGDSVWFHHNGWRTGTVMKLYSKNRITVRSILGEKHVVVRHKEQWVTSSSLIKV
jgi:hypothetical protein